ncbi:cyclic nucleotide-binding domain-containing protein [Archangium sp.]|uniref:cyclic nucleotide-binding domain-containing protein n=1 Tax=Archangium sp. TaxID=1872627 RepID=UPI002D3B2D66|nr:cyclic nucleotide-binding domain-containing protein [Archangium sp.]HYO51465.1 cyclic nucleotide-binding domain-containing protein [Archangium sp.]
MPRIASSEIVVPKSLSPEERRKLIDALYEVHRQIFDGVERESFAKYVVESKAEHTWIHVHKSEEGEIVGYLALHIFDKQFGGVPTSVLRAEAGSLRAYRGANANIRFWLKMALSYMLRNPGRRTFFLSSPVHPSSYSLVANHFGEVWPRRETEVPPELLAFMDELATEFGLEKEDPAHPLVRHVGWRTRETEMEREYWLHCDKPAARFFIEANPGYVEGHGLVTVVPITLSNIANTIRSMGQRKLRQPIQATVALAQRTSIGARLLRPEMMRQLRRASLFSHFDEATLWDLARRSEIFTIPGGKYLFHRGDASDEMYLLASGAVYVLAESGEHEKVVDELGSGSLFGEIAMLAGERRSASIRTATTSMLVRIPRSALLPLMEANASLRQGVWQKFAERRFDDMVRGLDRYGHLGRKGRLSWAQRGEHRALAAQEPLSLEAGTHVFVLSGVLEVEHEGLWVTARGSMLLEVERPLRVRAQEATRLILLSREAAPGPRRAVG